MTASKTKLLFGSNAHLGGWGRRGSASGMYSGGFNYYVYGIKGLFALTIYFAWGYFCHNNPNLK